MKILLCCIVALFNISLLKPTFAQKATKDVVPAENIIKSVQTLLKYQSNYLQLKDDFTAYDVNMHPLTREVFIRKLTTGDFLPLRIYSEKTKAEYRLYKLPEPTDPDIKRMLKQIGDTYYGYTLVEGKKFPSFHFQDLNGNVYTTDNTKGKIIVLKAWFTSCAPCIAEMPLLNKIKEEYSNRKDILFLSIAFDSKRALQKFAKHTAFNYAIIPVTAEFIEEKLHATGYPAHWVINKQGIVVNMSYNCQEMIAALSKEAAKK
ncbi:TlpA family protein disulfide reductase [Mucilaginibacter lacusdianchii]|uniref:TlpA family protein disulfide reductase n=1 Tax=Mucilaginibacter lacusdianchii TaxID=2684211 RepID=UPI00131BA652|nr:TlpA disulfide reductase family protein [Mucilaginibacter sp. JXJ CY 39]